METDMLYVDLDVE